MDATASLIAIVNLSWSLVKYIKDVKDGGKERKELREELIALYEVFEDLKSEFEYHESGEADGWSKPIKPLFKYGGPVDQLKAVLEELTGAIITPSQRAELVGRKLKWPFQKADIEKLLGRLRSLKGTISLTLTRASLEIGHNIKTGVQQVHSALETVAVENAVKWISSLDFRMSQKADQKQPLFGTGQWFLDDPQVRSWSECRTRALWCHGIPGAGKTVLASVMFQQLTEQNSTANTMVLMAYCSFDDKNTHSAYNILCSFVRQLVEQHGTMPESVEQLHAEYGKGLQQSRPDFARVVETISTELRRFDNVFVILDGLDELPVHHQRTKLLRTLESLDPLPQLMVTSRPVHHISEWFYHEASEGRYQLQGHDQQNNQASYCCDNCDKSASFSDTASSADFDVKSLGSGRIGGSEWRDEASYRCQNKSCNRDVCVNCYDKYDICLGCSSPKSCFQWAWPGFVTITAQAQDLQRYIAWRIDTSENLSTMTLVAQPKLSNLKSQIIRTVCREAHGMFLLAKFHMNSLEDQSNPRELLNGLKTLPSNVTDIYDSVIGRISNLKQAAVLKHMILIVATARQLLSLDAVAHAISLDHGDEDIDELKLPSVKHLVSMCAGLLELDYSGVVRLSHETIGDYIAQNGLKGSKDGHSTLTMICLTYLRFTSFASGAYSGPNHSALLQERRQKYPLLTYAATHWGIHARKMHDEIHGPSMISKLIMNFVCDDARISSASQFMWLDNLESSSGWDAEIGVHGLHLCAYFGLTAIISELSTQVTNVDVEDCHKTTPLMYAAQNGHTDIVHFLLHAGADPRRVCSRGSTALHRACRNGRADVVKEIVQLPKDIGVNALDEDCENYSALMHAIYYNDPEIVKMLLSRQDLDVELRRPGRLRPPNALLLAVNYGPPEMVKVLLSDCRVSIESVDSDQNTALSIAASQGDEDIVALLLDFGANIEARDFYGGTPLFRAIDKNSLRCVQVLVDLGADYAAKDRLGRGILHSCAVNGRGLVMRYLLESIPTLDVNVQGDRGETPLHDAVECNSEPVARILLAHGARTDIEDNSGLTPLRTARDNEQNRMFELLRQARLRENEKKDTILSSQTSTSAGEDEIKPPRRRDTLASEPGMTIHSASRKLSRKQLEKYLDELGPDPSTYINERDNHSNSPLHIAAAFGLNDNVRLLLERGADINSRDEWGFTPLHRAVETPPGVEVLDVLNSLLQRPSCDIDAVENLGRSALSLATDECFHPERACFLLKRQARFEAHDGRLLRVLNYAVQTNQIDVVSILAKGDVPLHIRCMGRLTPYQLAKQAGHDELAQYLFEWNRRRKHLQPNAPAEELASNIKESTQQNISDEPPDYIAGKERTLINAVKATHDSNHGHNYRWLALSEFGIHSGLSRREQGFVSIIILLCVLLYWK
ncbi:hypothetical protein JX266_012574 [Neoarthrinium moseri]|nr:hypothetical protein JX266_012574 [Neoarthrinium moseri]